MNPHIELQTLQLQRSRIISLSSKQTVRHREHILEFVFPFFPFFSQFQTKFSIFSVRLKIKGKINEKNTGRKRSAKILQTRPYTEVHWSLEVLLIANLSIVIFCRFPRREVRIPCDASSDSTRGALQDLRKLSRRFKSKQIT